MHIIMAKRLTRDEKRNNAVVDILNQMFIIAGHDVTYDDIKDRKDNWYNQWTMTMEQNEEWKKWGINYLKKNLKMNTFSAEREMGWFSLQWGLTFSDYK